MLLWRWLVSRLVRHKLVRGKPVMQLALDMLSIDEALRIAGLVAPFFEVLEVGTPLMFSEGVRAIEALRSRYPEKTILADMKIADAGDYEAVMAFDAGADLVSVLGVVDPRTIEGAVGAAKRRGGGVVIDTLNVPDLDSSVSKFERLGAACIEIHAGTDQAHDASDLVGRVGAAVSQIGIPVAVAGGLSPNNVGLLTTTGATVFVVGSSVTRANDPMKVAMDFRAVLHRGEHV